MKKFIFYFDIVWCKKYIEIEAETFRQARDFFFNRVNHLKRVNLHRVAEVNGNDYKIIYDNYKKN